MGAKSQKKGRCAELELAEVIRAHGFPAQAGAAVSYGATPDLTGLDGLHVEVKRHEKLEIPAWMKQAKVDAGRFGGVPVVMFRTNRQPWRVVLELGDFLDLYSSGHLRADRGK